MAVQINRSSVWKVLPVLVVGLCMFLPLFIVREVAEPSGAMVASAGASTAVVALGALFRSGARQVLRSTLMTAIRATTRTASRRVMRTLLPTLLRLFVPQLAFSESEQEAAGAAHIAPRLVLGLLGLALSFATVVWLKPPEVAASLLGGLPIGVAATLAAVPMLLHFAVLWFSCRRAGVLLHFHLPVDGVLIQAYFSGAASFLPILTDVELIGERRAKALCAGTVLAFLLVAQFVCQWLAGVTGRFELQYLSSIFLIYGFVYSFPLHPLDGKDVWDYSRVAWLALWGANTFAFLNGLPEAMYAIL